MKVALELGNDINAVDNHGETAMHGAAYKHVPSVVEYLAGAGAKIDVWNHWNADGRTPLDITIGIPSSMSIIRSAVTEATIRNVMLREGVTPHRRRLRRRKPVHDRSVFLAVTRKPHQFRVTKAR